MNTAQWLLGLLFALSAGYTIWGFPRRYGALSGRSRLFRTLGLLLLDLLLGLVWAALFIDFARGATPQVGKVRFLLYATACLFLALALLCVAVLDALESYTTVRREQRRLVEEMLRSDETRPPV